MGLDDLIMSSHCMPVPGEQLPKVLPWLAQEEQGHQLL